MVTLYGDLIAPFETAVYAPNLLIDDRKSAIVSLSKNLDVIEGAVRGPLLSGSSLSTADAQLYPSVALLHMTLPTHFGWTEWTEEALYRCSDSNQQGCMGQVRPKTDAGVTAAASGSDLDCTRGSS